MAAASLVNVSLSNTKSHSVSSAERPDNFFFFIRIFIAEISISQTKLQHEQIKIILLYIIITRAYAINCLLLQILSHSYLFIEIYLRVESLIGK